MAEILETSEISEIDSTSVVSSDSDLLYFEGVVAVVDHQQILESLRFWDESYRVGFGLQFDRPNSLEPVR